MDAEEAKRLREMEQAETFVIDRIPRLVWSMYNSYISEGFSPEQALALAKCYVHGLGGGKLTT